MSRGARLLMTVSLCALAAGCVYRPAPDVGTLNPTFLDDLDLRYVDIPAVRSMVPQGPAFSDQLRVGYLELADEMAKAKDGSDQNHFLRKAVASAKGIAQVPDQVVMPDDLSFRRAGTDFDGSLAAARARLVDAFGREARTRAPLDAADAQVAFDCWFEGVEAGRLLQTNRCRTRFLEAMGRVDKALAGEEQPYIVFFAWNDATMSPVGQQVLQQVATDYQAGKAPRIVLAGHADRSGDAGYNLILSKRRAENAAAALAALGVPRSAMDVTWYGETRPRVPTADGVREPENRRVEFTFPAQPSAVAQ